MHDIKCTQSQLLQDPQLSVHSALGQAKLTQPAQGKHTDQTSAGEISSPWSVFI